MPPSLLHSLPSILLIRVIGHPITSPWHDAAGGRTLWPQLDNCSTTAVLKNRVPQACEQSPSCFCLQHYNYIYLWRHGVRPDQRSWQQIPQDDGLLLGCVVYYKQPDPQYQGTKRSHMDFRHIIRHARSPPYVNHQIPGHLLDVQEFPLQESRKMHKWQCRALRRLAGIFWILLLHSAF